jgi:hypothetical protein
MHLTLKKETTRPPGSNSPAADVGIRAMHEIHSIYAIVRNPNPNNRNDQGQVTTGYYILADGVLTKTNSEGTPIRGLNGGDKITHKIEAGERPADGCKPADAEDLPDASRRDRAGRDDI